MKKYIVLLFISFIAFITYGQSISSYVVASAGESAEAGGISISWTLGEIAIETLTDNAGTLTLTQGFQQGYFEITSIGEPLSNNFNLKVYPNPATEYVWISLESEEIQNAIIELFDINGKLMHNEKLNVTNGPNKIQLNGLNSDQYILRVSNSDGSILQTFKLVKR